MDPLLGSSSPTAASAERAPARGRVALALAALLLLALLIRLPLLHDADYRFTSDEAVDALVVRHLLSGQELTLFNWDSTYYGIAEGLLTVPFLPILGQSAAAFKLGAVAGHWLLMIAVYLLATRLYGRRAGLLAAATLVAFSPVLLYWSTLASGGYSLVVAIGTLALWQLDRVDERPSAGRILALGLICGLGFYVYQLFVVYLAALGVWVLPRSAPWQRFFGGPRAAARPALAALRQDLSALGIAGLGFAAGASPVLARLLAGATGGSKEPSYAVAGLETVRPHLELLLLHAAPVLLGVRSVAGRLPPFARPLGLLFAGTLVAAWLIAAARALPELASSLRARSRGIGAATLLVLLVPLTALLFVLSPNVQDVLSNRYLLPWLSALSVLAGALLARWSRRGAFAVAAVSLILLAPCAATLLSLRDAGTLDEHWRPRAHAEPLVALVAELERHRIRGAYAPYWTAYKATFLAAERVVVTPLDGWDRYPPYTALVDAAVPEAYVFTVDPPNVSPADAAMANAARERFEAKLAAAELACERRDFGFYRAYWPTEPGRRLLPPPLRAPVQALAKASATFRLLDPPSAVAGRDFRIRADITNTSDGSWSADGVAKESGSRRVAVAYRWLNEGGQAVVVEGLRTPLPHDVPVGETLRLAVRVEPPPTAGPYVLRLTLVQENVAWFDQATSSQVDWPVDVR